MIQGKFGTRARTGLVIFLALAGIILLNWVNSQQSPEQQVEELIHQHQGALLVLKSGTDQDKQFQLAIAEVKPPLRGKAGVVTVSPRQGKRLVN
ncbi:MAG: hypothetical protein NC911_08895, partial [Candidatus Omnitrophica bacterium]|nr:hypothetical protein [Candidatus Omnitrophota bacterium]